MDATAGELLALCREMKGLTLQQVEDETGIDHVTLWRAETGKGKLAFKTAIKLCDFYAISLDRLANTIRKQPSSKRKD